MPSSVKVVVFYVPLLVWDGRFGNTLNDKLSRDGDPKEFDSRSLGENTIDCETM